MKVVQVFKDRFKQETPLALDERFMLTSGRSHKLCSVE